MSDLSGIWVAIVTPFHNDATHSVDHAALRRLVQHLRQAEVTGLVALGSTGEAAALDDAEQDAVLDTVLDAAQGLPVIGGLAGNHVGHLHARLAHLNTLPLHAVLSPAPYYVRPSQAALVHHFQDLAERSHAPLVLYDIPYRTGVAMDLHTILTLAEHPHITGIKDCGGSLDKTQQLIADGRLQVLAGEDAQIFHNLCLGGAGAITAAAQTCPEGFMKMYGALREGQLKEARQWQHLLSPLIRALYAEPNPSVVKAVLANQGLVTTISRAPHLAASEEARRAATQVLDRVLREARHIGPESNR
ncbi:MAG TPA: 4-hydroxy-tetrahydrodipicolinate synthase [Aquabacterium sp.]|uniref:4-hydroxy-tetrahydrodipicolinate synthase n=1 Tax=Aquabacterium sp. TaxID=1872578 RepID=UPI002E35DA73|nr:4-hydroxy-tetrahydrodipicolinate synthase [Aquabacterium sp.]HEX5355569.1 4-hydroxy-tetrahydrodipicolinate synthase [Aquabacterium sp.]